MGICASTEKDHHDPVDKQGLDDAGKANGTGKANTEKQIAVQPKKTDPQPAAAASNGEVQLSANAGAASAAAPAPAAGASGGSSGSSDKPDNKSASTASSGNTLTVPGFDGQPRTSTTVVGQAEAENVQIALVDTPTSAQEIANYLKNVPVLAKLSHEDRVVLAEALKLKQYKVGSPIVREGEEGHEFFIIKRGKAVVTRRDPDSKKEVELGKLNAGDYFGETALLTDARRGATITAFEADVLCLTLERKTFSDHFSKHKLNVAYAKRAAVSAEASGQDDKGSADEKKNTTKDAAKRKVVLDAIKVNMLFRNLTIEQQESIVDKMWLRDVKSGTKIISQGELGDTFYVVDSGEFDIFKDGKQVAHRAAGSSFGELALMYNAPRAATVQAKTACTVWMVDRNTYRHLMTDTSVRRLKEIEAFLRTVQLFAPLTDAERSKIGEALEEANFPDAYPIVKQGDEGDTFFILKKGETVCTQQETPQSAPKEIKRYVAGEYFGERALIKNAPRAATITTVGACAVYYMNRQAFTQLLGPLEEILKARADSYKLLQDEYKKRQEAAAARGETLNEVPSSPRSAANAASAATAQTKTDEPPSHLDKNIKFSDLTIIGTLGKGSFGHVQLVRDRSNKTHALKSVNKAQIVQLGQQEHIMSEKRVMAQLDHPFLVRLNATFKDQNYLYFLLEPSLGGELFSVLRAKTFFDEETARFFAASVVLAFEYMHVKDIIYRDLKPENLLLDDLGYLKITDFGFAKKVKDRTWTLCGTPDYLAPEVVSGQGHGKGVDWWTLGILIYEMLASYPPFYDEDPMKTYAKIMHGHVAFPMHFSKAAIDLIKQLLHPKPTKRLGVIKGGASLIKSHAWFKGFDWDAFLARKLPAPIKNNIKNAEDLSNFEKYPDEELNPEPYVPDPKNPNWDLDF